jgi:phage repressor protein C with HTH and peptisase S24 domain
MKYNQCIEALSNLIGYKPTCAEIARILGAKSTAIVNRANRDSKIKDEEIELLEAHYAVAISRDVENFVELDFYPEVFGSCGDGCTVFEESSTKLQVTKDVITNYSSNNKYSIISARGSSMSPVINDDDRLIIQHNVESQIIDDTVYLFRYNGELFIKRLVKNVDQIVCISENPRFQDRIIVPQEDNFSIIGKVVGLFRSKV